MKGLSTPLRAVVALASLALAVADSAWVRSGSLPVTAGAFLALALFWAAMAAFAIAIVPPRAWTHTIAAGCVLIGWPVAFGIARMSAVCGNAPGLLDLPLALFMLAPFFALIAAVWTPIPFGAIAIAAAVGAGLQRLSQRTVPMWELVLAAASIPVVWLASYAALRFLGVHVTPCITDF